MEKPGRKKESLIIPEKYKIARSLRTAMTKKTKNLNSWLDSLSVDELKHLLGHPEEYSLCLELLENRIKNNKRCCNIFRSNIEDHIFNKSRARVLYWRENSNPWFIGANRLTVDYDKILDLIRSPEVLQSSSLNELKSILNTFVNEANHVLGKDEAPPKGFKAAIKSFFEALK